MNLEEYLNNYKELTLSMMERVKIDGSIQYLVEKREYILEQIKSGIFSDEEVKSMGKKLNLDVLEKELDLLVKQEIVDTKKQIQKLKRAHSANMQYASIGYIPSSFNKKM